MMPQEIIQKIEQVGHISVVNGTKLRIEVPPGYLTEEDKQTLRERKREVIYHLKDRTRPYLDERPRSLAPQMSLPRQRRRASRRQVNRLVRQLDIKKVGPATDPAFIHNSTCS